MADLPKNIDESLGLLADQNYKCGRDLVTIAILSIPKGKPVLLEGEARVGNFYMNFGHKWAKNCASSRTGKLAD